jgi:diaminopimelate decarboxylase
VEPPSTHRSARPWWSRGGLEPRNGRLTIAGRDAETLARRHGTPLYVYDLQRIGEKVRDLQGALSTSGLPHRVRLALKAQRAPEALAAVRSLGAPGSAERVGIDACSPGEVLHALEHGWSAEEISYTGTNVSDRDLDVVLAHPIHLNVDLLTQLDRVGRRAPGRTVGLRVNPRAGAGYRGTETLYSGGARPTKFGIFPEQLDDAIEIARRHKLTVDTVHFHVGDGFLTEDLPRFERAVERVSAMAAHLIERGCPLAEVNTGGGLGIPTRAGDEPLDLDAYASMLARHLGPLGVVVGVEPGDFLVKESAVLLAEVVSVEDRDARRFVGVDAGWNVVNEGFIYGARQEVVVCVRADAPAVAAVTVAGHINEGNDVFAEDRDLPPVREGDVIAILHCGSYAQSMTIVHCLRPPAPAVFFEDRPVERPADAGAASAPSTAARA